MDVFEAMVELAQSMGYSEEHARLFATGRAGSEREAREQLGATPAGSPAGAGAGAGGTVPSGLYPEVEQSVALEAAAFNLSKKTARQRVMFLVEERLPEGIESARRALLAHQGRLGGRR